MKFIKQTVKGKHQKALYECKCGKIKECRIDHVKSKLIVSCGCARKTHGHSVKGHYSKEYLTWQSMINRCYCKSNARYNRYGGRGIEVCSEWKNSFEQFLKDMGNRPDGHYSIDRINNDGNYEPSNCRWADAFTQAINKRGAIVHSSKFKGVYYSNKRKRFIAQIQVNKKNMWLLSSKSEIECAAAYNEAAKKYFGESAFLNKI